MTVLQDVRLVNESRPGNDSYLYEYWILLPHMKAAVQLRKWEGWSGDEDWQSEVFEQPEIDMPEDVQEWFYGRTID